MRIALRAALAAILLALPARATWSILIVDTATGEVAIGIATCLTGFDLRPSTVVVVPGFGVAAAQSFVGPLSLRRQIRQELLAGTPPQLILTALSRADPGHQSRQYGIVDTSGRAATFTGTGAGAFANGITGSSGTLVYAIQGNVITGQPVLSEAARAIQTTTGDVAQKLMAAMQAARAMGGDGRCSCSVGPTGCGSPPASFSKSAHIGLMIVSRPGDVDLDCSSALGCGAGFYFMDLNVANQQVSDPDPVVQLQALFDAFRAGLVGRPDHFRSTATPATTTIRANGRDRTLVTVTLRDLNGAPLGNTIPLTASLHATSTATGATVGPVTAQPGGTYTFEVAAGITPGDAVLDIVADDGVTPVTVGPRPVVRVGDPFGACGVGAVPDGSGGVVPVLRVDGSVGTDRVERVGFLQPFQLSIDPPPMATGPMGAYFLWADVGIPGPGAAAPVGPLGGSLCFTPFPISSTAQTIRVTNSLGAPSLFGGAPPPWSTTVPGIPAILDLTLQGVMVAGAGGELAATNAILLRVTPLPPPAVTAVTPRSAAPGTSVTVRGTDFYQGLTATLAGRPLSVQSVTQTAFSFTMPPWASCDPVLAVANPGTTTVTETLNPSPRITGTPFSSGPAAGGGFYVVQGVDLDGATVRFGNTPMTVFNQGPTSITGFIPPGAPGVVTVTVESPAGCSDTTTFTYL